MASSNTIDPQFGNDARAPSPWTLVSDEAVGTLHVGVSIDVDADGTIVVRRDLVDGRGQMHGGVMELALECDDRREAELRLLAIDSFSDSPLLTVKALGILGAERFAERIALAAEAQRAAAVAADQAAINAARRRAELDRTIVVRKGGGKTSPRVELRRGGSDESFFSIGFGEGWERDRFLDWFRWQHGRLQEFADFLDANDPSALRARLLREMIEAERLARSNKLTTSGRRPLRLWCGQTE